ncbi:MAG: hypothetical protein IPM57_10620 [Oligoflexia bacterium]|nr:hypothetical protein [Oligoflexia bacterium]
MPLKSMAQPPFEPPQSCSQKMAQAVTEEFKEELVEDTSIEAQIQYYLKLDLAKNTIGDLVPDKINKKPTILREWTLASTNGHDIYKLDFETDIKTGETILKRYSPATEATQTAYYHAVAELKKINDLNISINPSQETRGIKNVIIPRNVIAKADLVNGVKTKDIIQAFENKKSGYFKSPDVFIINGNASTRFVIFSKTDGGVLLRIVFVINNNAFKILAAAKVAD